MCEEMATTGNSCGFLRWEDFDISSVEQSDCDATVLISRRVENSY
jgi:hypothetical protein